MVLFKRFLLLLLAAVAAAAVAVVGGVAAALVVVVIQPNAQHAYVGRRVAPFFSLHVQQTHLLLFIHKFTALKTQFNRSMNVHSTRWI